MSKLLKYHVIGGAIDAGQPQQPSSSSSGGTTTVGAATTVSATTTTTTTTEPRPTEPDIFQLPPLPATGAEQAAEAAPSA